MAHPTIPLTDPRFVYVNKDHTNIRERFDRIRQEQAQSKASNVKPIQRKAK
jgi:hypothetical protein